MFIILNQVEVSEIGCKIDYSIRDICLFTYNVNCNTYGFGVLIDKGFIGKWVSRLPS